jgi:hypothetical protein
VVHHNEEYIFWKVIPCSQSTFEEGTASNFWLKEQVEQEKEEAEHYACACCPCLVDSSILKVDVGSFYKNTWCYITENGTVQAYTYTI